MALLLHKVIILRTFLIILEKNWQRTAAAEVNQLNSDGEAFVERVVDGEKNVVEKPEYLSFTAPYKICKGECSNDEDNFVMEFPIYIGKKGLSKYKDFYRRDHLNVHSGKPNAPLKPRPTKKLFTLCPDQTATTIEETEKEIITTTHANTQEATSTTYDSEREKEDQITEIYHPTELQTEPPTATKLPTSVDLETDFEGESTLQTIELQNNNNVTICIAQLQTEVDLQTQSPANTEEDLQTQSSINTEVDLQTQSPANTEEDLQTQSSINTEVDLQTQSPANTEVDLQTQSSINTEVNLQTESPINTEIDLQTESPINTEVDLQSQSPNNNEVYLQTQSPINTVVCLQTQLSINTEVDIQTQSPMNTELDLQTQSITNIGHTDDATLLFEETQKNEAVPKNFNYNAEINHESTKEEESKTEIEFYSTINTSNFSNGKENTQIEPNTEQTEVINPASISLKVPNNAEEDDNNDNILDYITQPSNKLGSYQKLKKEFKKVAPGPSIQMPLFRPVYSAVTNAMGEICPFYICKKKYKTESEVTDKDIKLIRKSNTRIGQPKEIKEVESHRFTAANIDINKSKGQLSESEEFSSYSDNSNKNYDDNRMEGEKTEESETHRNVFDKDSNKVVTKVHFSSGDSELLHYLDYIYESDSN